MQEEGRSSMHLEGCNEENHIAQIAPDLFTVIIEAIQGPEYKDTEEYMQEKIRN
jgi:hypothetical protein